MSTQTTLATQRQPLSTGVTLLLVLALHAAGVAAFGPTFSGRPGWIAAGGGVLVGLLVAALAARFRWGTLLTTAAGLVAYLLCGAALAVPRTAFAGVVPTLDSLQRLALLMFQSWRDLLTVTTPADRFTGPAVVPYLAGLVCGLLAASIALRTGRALLALIPPVVLLAVAIAFGTQVPFAPGWLAAGLIVTAVAYAAWIRRLTNAAGRATLITKSGRRAFLAPIVVPVLATLLALAVVGGAAIWVGPAVSAGDRHVLRDRVEPPLDLRDYASPLTSYRYWEVDLAEETLFTVTGLPEGARLRLATLDTFDGHVYNVARDSASFVRTGDRIDGPAAGRTVGVEVGVREYAGVWLPGVGEWRGVEFMPQDAGARALAQGDTLYHSRSTSTALTTTGLGAGDRYRMTGDLVSPTDRKVLREARAVGDRLPPASRVPEIVTETAEEFAGADGTDAERLGRLESRLRDGFFSNGKDGKSRAGHTSERIETLLGSPQLIGDDEQYAVAMALMARDLGYPARVVLGFYPDPKAPAPAGIWAARGTDAHVWVEVDFGQHGWVTFDPTPDRDRVPNTEVPRPQPKPKPQVPPPPQPPPQDAEDEPDVNSTDRALGDRTDVAALLAVLRVIGTVLAVAAAMAAPFLLIAFAKRQRRTRRRRTTRLADQASGSWDELVDTAIDHGDRPPRNATRLAEARALAAAHPHLRLLVAARLVDDQVYGPEDPAPDAVDRAWQSTGEIAALLRRDLTKWQRIVGFCSLRSFWAGRGVQQQKTGEKVSA